MSATTMLVRADGSAAIGMGHLMRCLALAEVHGPGVTFLSSGPPAAFLARLESVGVDVCPLAAPAGSPADLRETLDLARARRPDWVVLDGYSFSPAFQADLVAAGHQVLILEDDGHAGRYVAHLVLDGGVGADAARYANRAPHTRLLLGPRYALLREEFRGAPPPRGLEPEGARRLIVAFGGSDPDDLSRRTLDELAAIPDRLEIEVLLGAANPHEHSVNEAARRCPHPVTVSVDAPQIARRLAAGDLAVSAAGGMATELARVGTPALIVTVAPNQELGARALAAAGAAVDLGRAADLAPGEIGQAVHRLAADAARRQALSNRGRELVDGHGAERVLAAMARELTEGLTAA